MTVSPNGADLFVTGSGDHYDGYYTLLLSTANGQEAWMTFSRVAPHERISESPTAITVNAGSSIVYVTGAQGTVALNTSDGSTLWKKYAPGALGISLALSQDSSVLAVVGCESMSAHYYQCSSTKLTAYNASTGAVLWALRDDDATWVTASRTGPQMFVASDESGHNMITAFDVAQGTHRTRLWRIPAISGQLALNRNGSTLVAGLGTGTVATYDAATGALSSTFTYTFAGSVSAMAISTDASKLFVLGGGSSPGYLTTAYGL
jgi:outer membrane protein assembly factor BamB